MSRLLLALRYEGRQLHAWLTLEEHESFLSAAKRARGMLDFARDPATANIKFEFGGVTVEVTPSMSMPDVARKYLELRRARRIILGQEKP